MLDFETVTRASFSVAGLATRTSNSRPDQIGALWQEFYGRNILAQIPNKRSSDVYSVYIDYESDHNGPYTLIIGCEVDKDTAVPEGLSKQQVPGARFSVFDANGKQPDALISTWQKIPGMNLKRTFSGDFDLYRNVPGTSQPDVRVFVAVE